MYLSRLAVKTPVLSPSSTIRFIGILIILARVQWFGNHKRSNKGVSKLWWCVHFKAFSWPIAKDWQRKTVQEQDPFKVLMAAYTLCVGSLRNSHSARRAAAMQLIRPIKFSKEVFQTRKHICTFSSLKNRINHKVSGSNLGCELAKRWVSELMH